MEIKEKIKFCVCAMTDLLGFSNHLEISSYDLRTNIGEQAVTRLQNIEEIIDTLKQEESKRKDYYPSELHIQRINDGVFFTMDLDDLLIPSVGRTSFEGLSSKHIEKYFPNAIEESIEDFESSYKKRMDEIIDPLTKFLGIISRFHLSLNKREAKSFFPGAKTVISTGFRRPFLTPQKGEDPFSANFALSNAYKAESILKGARLYIDNSILQMISFNRYVNNIVRLSHLNKEKAYFDSFEYSDDVFSISTKYNVSKHIDIKIFRKDFRFISLNAGTLAYLQTVSMIMPFLDGKSKPKLKNVFYKNVFHAIQQGIELEETKQPSRTFILNDSLDLDVDIALAFDFIKNGGSLIKEALAKKKLDEETSLMTEDGKTKWLELMEQEVETDFETVRLEDCIDIIFSLGEDTLSSILFMIEGDLEILDYKKKSI